MFIGNPIENQPGNQPGVEERILLAAEHEFLAKGYAGARTTAIAEAAGVTPAMLHYYYRTKEKLFDTVMSAKIDLIAKTVMVPMGDDSLSLEETIRQGVGRHFDLVRANAELPQFMISQVFSNPELLDMLKDKIGAKAQHLVMGLQAKIDAAAAKGECREVSAMNLLLDIISLNIIPFTALPMLRQVVPNVEAFLDSRKKENIETIIRKLKL